jgi:hypothetical protein
VGKSTVAGLLADRGAVAAVCEVDKFRAMLTGVDWRDRRQHEIALDAALRASAVFLNGGRSPVLIVDTFGRGAAADAATSLRASGVAVAACSLWADEGVLVERLRCRARGYADEEMARVLNAEIHDTRVGDMLVDTTHLGPAEVAGLVAALLGGIRG